LGKQPHPLPLGCSNKLANVYVGGGAILTGTGCTFNDAGASGLCVTDSSSSATIIGGSISNNGSSNIKAMGGGNIVLSGGCQCNGAKGGNGWLVEGAGSSLEATGCRATGSSGPNVNVGEGSKASLVSCDYGNSLKTPCKVSVGN